jgi:hypothetical protein
MRRRPPRPAPWGVGPSLMLALVVSNAAPPPPPPPSPLQRPVVHVHLVMRVRVVVGVSGSLPPPPNRSTCTPADLHYVLRTFPTHADTMGIGTHDALPLSPCAHPPPSMHTPFRAQPAPRTASSTTADPSFWVHPVCTCCGECVWCGGSQLAGATNRTHGSRATPHTWHAPLPVCGSMCASSQVRLVGGQ